MLDWSVRGITVGELSSNKILFAHGANSLQRMTNNDHLNQKYIQSGSCVNISSALRSHKDIDHSISDDTGFTEVEQFVRDEFDWFLFKLGVFG